MRGTVSLAVPLAVVVLIGPSILTVAQERTAINFFISLVAVVGLGVYAGNSGIMSFGHVAFMALGAYCSGLLTISPELKHATMTGLPTWLADAHLALLPAICVSILAVAVFALIVGIPIARLSGASAVIATLALLVIVNVVLTGAEAYTRGAQTFYGIMPALSLAGVFAISIVVLFIARWFRESNLGLSLRASREDDLAARSTGVNLERVRLVSWVLSACIMVVAGALLGNFLTAFSPNTFYYGLTFSLIGMLVIGGMATVSGAVVGAAFVTLLSELLRNFEDGPGPLPDVFGLPQIGIGIAILLILYKRREGLLGRRELDEIIATPFATADGPADTRDPQPKPVRADPDHGGGLVVNKVSKHFAGLQALSEVSLTLESGEIVGLIGPNGSGKTTLLNTISGVMRPDGGDVILDGSSMGGERADRLSRAGVGRTFQNIRLFRSLSVLENVEAAVGAHRLPGSRDGIARAVLSDFELDHVDRLAGQADYGRQRRLEIARALATNPRYLLLDEPAAGMNPVESAELMRTLQRVRDDYRVGLLVIDHDLELIMKMCSRVLVLNSGRLIAEGTPAEVQADPAVIEAYLGLKRSPNKRKVESI